MIPSGVAVYFAVEPVDLRCGIDRLSGFAAGRVGYDARGRALFVFVGKRRAALKILFFDGSGMCLFYKRLDCGTFRLPDDLEPEATHVEIDEATLDALLDGVAVEQASPRKRGPTVH